MKLTEYDIELINDFYQGRMNQDEQDVFNQRRNQDAEFDTAVDEMILVLEGIRAEARKSLLDDMRKWDSNLEFEQPTPIIRMSTRIFNRYWNYASAAVVFLMLFLRLNLGLGSGYYVAWTSIVFRSTDSVFQQATVSEAGMAYYYDQKYQRALNTFKLQDDSNEHVQFMIGNCYFAQKRYRKALKHLSNTAIQQHPILQDDALWYSSLCQLALGKTQDAYHTLVRLRDSSIKHSKEAIHLLEKRRFRKYKKSKNQPLI